MTQHHAPGSGGCREIFGKLSEYLDGELPDNLCAEIDRHMADCPPCEVFLRTLRRTVEWVEADDASAIPDDVRRSVRQAYRLYREGGS